MNCDDAFDALTDPALAQSAELATHLARCPRCRQLQQVLEPARSLLCGDLPVERVPAEKGPNETLGAHRPKASLPAEAVGVADAIAAQLSASSVGKSVPARRPLVTRRVVLAGLRGGALVLFGALAVYCIGPRDRDSDSHSLPALVPPSRAAAACTRMDLGRKRQGTQNARRVILSCVDCHLNEGQAPRPQGSTSFFWPPRRAPRISIAWDSAGDWAASKGMGKHAIRTATEARMS